MLGPENGSERHDFNFGEAHRLMGRTDKKTHDSGPLWKGLPSKKGVSGVRRK